MEGLDSRDVSGVTTHGELGDPSGKQEREVRAGGGWQLAGLSDYTKLFSQEG